MERTSKEFERNEFYSNELYSPLEIQDVAQRREKRKTENEWTIDGLIEDSRCNLHMKVSSQCGKARVLGYAT